MSKRRIIGYTLLVMLAVTAVVILATYFSMCSSVATAPARYVEWNGLYMLCDQPLKLSTPPLMVYQVQKEEL